MKPTTGPRRPGRRCGGRAPVRTRRGPGRCRRGDRYPWRRRCRRNGDPRVERLLRRFVEGVQVHQRNRNAVDLLRNRRVHGVHHLGGDRRLRSRPLRAATKHRTRVGDAVLGRYEKRVGGDVVDEGEFPHRMGRQTAGLACCEGRPGAADGGEREEDGAGTQAAAEQTATRQALGKLEFCSSIVRLLVILGTPRSRRRPLAIPFDSRGAPQGCGPGRGAAFMTAGWSAGTCRWWSGCTSRPASAPSTESSADWANRGSAAPRA